MPPPPEGPSPSEAWLEDRFAEYYRQHPPQLPDRSGRREYGFLFFGRKMMWRHIGFGSRPEFERFHREKAPAHSYYSTAYYEHPDAPTMAEKGWRGAELIFDLDADHVPGAEKLAYPDQLRRVKDYFVKLVDKFILADFGFAEKDLLLTFSGGRGYHCHVLAEKALELTSQERREIVDYVTGTGLDVETFLQQRTVVEDEQRKYRRVKRTLRIASAEAPGWGRRLNEGLRQYFSGLKAMPTEQRLQVLEEVPGIGKKEAQYINRQLALLTDEHVARGFVDRGPAFHKLVPYVVKQQVIPLAKGETDEPVTSDTKRLIRTPGTLHGKSGLRVVPLTRSQLDEFDPLRDAVAFSDEPQAVEVTKAGTVSLKGETLKLEPGAQRVPEWAAVFAMMRGWARPAA